MKIIITTLLLILLSGCYEQGETRTFVRNEYYCTPDTLTERSKFTLECIKNANPKSDEELEDWIMICNNITKDTFCLKVPTKVTQSYRGSFWFDVSKEPLIEK